jgi:hypothetical protein
VSTYQDAKAQAEARLKTNFNPADYPSVAVVRSRFYLTWQYLTFSTPGKLKEISQDFFKQEQAKAASQWQQATEEITLLLRANLKDMVDHMIEQLKPGEDGKKKKFYESSVTKIKTFLENFEIRNVSDDAQLSIIVNHAKNLLDGVEAKEIRDNEAVRGNLSTGFTAMKTYLDQMVTEAGSRRIVLDDEADPDFGV